jgi:hypothetical protein
MAYDPDYHREYYQRNKERKREQGRLWEMRNRDKVRSYAKNRRDRLIKENPQKLREAQKKWEDNNPEKILLKSAKNRAKQRGLEFNIELEDIVIPDFCPLLEIKLVKRVAGHGPKDSSPSLDRIDSSKGYIKGNVWVISALANRIKTNATPEQIITVANNLQKLGKSDVKKD